jgi:spore coat polysaccharide biosynthesis protein SpsF
MEKNNKISFIVTIEARMTSSRLPGKVCMKLTNSRNVLEVLIDRIKKSNYVKKILIATTQNKIDDKIVRIAKKNKCLFFRGSENNVLSRLVLGTKKHKENSIIQLTGDNPLIDAKIIDYMASFFISKYPRYDFVTNNNLFNKTRSVPIGMNVSIFKKSSLQKIITLAKKEDHFEHPTLYFYREGRKKFKIKNVKMPEKWCSKLNPRLTLDTKEDLKFLRKIYEKLKNIKNFTISDILNFIENNRDILKINNKIKQKIPKNLL